MARDIRTISIFCAKCRTLLYKYRKSGRGGLVKCRPDRIVEDRTAGDLKCPDCGQDFARLAMMGGGPAHKIIQGPTRTGSALTELERCLRWGSSWSGRRRHPRKTDACQVVPYRNLIGERGDEAYATADRLGEGCRQVQKNPREKSTPRSAMRPSLGGDGGGGLRHNHEARRLVAFSLD